MLQLMADGFLVLLAAHNLEKDLPVCQMGVFLHLGADHCSRFLGFPVKLDLRDFLFNGGGQFGLRKRLEQIIGRTEVQGFLHVREVVERADKDDLAVQMAAENAPCHVKPVHFRHSDIKECNMQ